jgi:hypothetical protein
MRAWEGCSSASVKTWVDESAEMQQWCGFTKKISCGILVTPSPKNAKIEGEPEGSPDLWLNGVDRQKPSQIKGFIASNSASELCLGALGISYEPNELPDCSTPR